MKKISALLLVLLPFIAFPQDNFKALDSILNVYDQGVMPGVSVSIAKSGKVLYERKVGYADIEAAKKIDNNTVFCMASVSKQFTAACIVMLEQQGKLSLEDKLSKYFPNFPYADRISITDLLNHTSGIKDYLALSLLRGDVYRDYNNDDIYNLISRQEPDFEPGSKQSYSNSGYWFLVQIVQKVSGAPIADFAQENIFRPLKMKSAQYSYNPYLIKNAAKGYVNAEDDYEVSPQEQKTIAGGGVIATVSDMQKWLFEMHSQKILGTAFWNRMLNEKLYDMGNGYFYTKGLAIGDYHGKKRIEHGGDVHGFHTMAEYFPEDGVTVIMVTNNDDVNVFALNKPALSKVLGLKYEAKPKSTNHSINEQNIGVTVSVNDLKLYEGKYGSDMGISFSITVKQDGLYVVQDGDSEGGFIESIGKDRFEIPDAGIFFEFSDIKNGFAHLLSVEQEGEKYIFKKDLIVPDFNEYTGVYYSKVLDINYEFVLQDGWLEFKPEGTSDTISILMKEKDKGETLWGSISFIRNDDSTVKGFSLSHLRAKNIYFVKVAATE